MAAQENSPTAVESASPNTGSTPAVTPPPQPLNPAAKKLQKLLESRFETDKEAIAAMQYLSEVMPDNTIAARRNLRSDLERRNLATSRDFLNKFKVIRDELHALSDVVDEISTSCTSK